MGRRILLGALLLLVLAGGAVVLHRLWAFAAFSAPPPEPPGPAAASGLPERLGAPGAPLRVALLGTSLTAGGDWPERVEAALSACRPAGAEVRVVARPGAASPWGAQAIARALEPSPDLLVMEFSINDASLARGTPLPRAAALLDAMLARAEAAGVPVLLATMNPAWGREAWERPGQTAYRALYHARAAAGRAALLDTVPAWRALPEAERAALVPDGLHPTPEAMARLHVPALVEALRGPACGG